MNKNLLGFLVASIILHVGIFISVNGEFLRPKSNFSQKKGESQIRARLQIFERKTKKTKQVKRKKKSIAKSKTPKKLDKKLTEKKQNTPPSKSAKGFSEAGDQKLISQYLTAVRDLIAANKSKTRMATRLNLKGKVKLNFMIKKPNLIEDLKVIESSGLNQIDASALNTVKATDNLPIIPSKLERNEIPVSLVIEYE